MIKKNLLRLTAMLTLGSALMVACQRGGFEDQKPSSEGLVSLSLSTDSTTYDIQIQSAGAQTKAEPALSENDFKISLENTKAEVLAQWDSFADVPEQIKMVFGSYKLIASYGNIEDLPAFEKPVYGAEAKFALDQQIPNLEVNLDCKPLATKIDFAFEDSFDYTYDKYEIEAKTSDVALHHTAADFSREGYYTPGALRLKLLLWSKKDPNTCHEYYYDTKIKTQAAEFYHIKLNAINKTGDLGITITTNNSTYDITLEESLPDFWLPKAKPEVISHSFGEDMSVETSRGALVEANALLKTYAGVKEFTIKTTSQEILDMGFPAEGVNVVGAADNAESAAAVEILKNLGVSWSPKLNNAEDAAKLKSNTPLELSFTDMTMNLDMEGTHNFTVDLKDFEVEQNMETLAFEVVINPLDFNVKAMTLPDVWATFAEAKVTYHTDREGFVPVMQVSVDGGTNWSTPANTRTEIEKGNEIVSAKGLAPSTNYKFRIRFDDQAIAGVTNIMQTEDALQIPNGNMEEWTVKDINSDWCGYQLAYYTPWTSNQHWDTCNEKTTWYGGHGFGLRNQYTWACSVVYTPTAHTGSKAAEVRNISAQIKSSPVNSAGENCEANRIAGHLFIGDYDDGYKYGRTFGSRPQQISFWYQYIPYGEDEFKVHIKVWNETNGVTTQLGYGEYTERRNTAMSGYTQKKVDINYEVKTLRATHYTVKIVSSTADTPPVQENVSIDYPGSEDVNLKGHIGSKLRIDDIELSY